MDKYVIAPPSGSTQNSVGAQDRPWKEGHFESVKLNGGDLGEYLAESTGYGIISGCEPTISGLTVTVGAGIVHLADGTRKEIDETSVTLDAADTTNPRIDLVYITSTGEVAKVTGTAAASPVVPIVPENGITVCVVTMTAGSQNGILSIRKKMNEQSYGKVQLLFPKNLNPTQVGECQIIVTQKSVTMIDSHYNINGQFDYLVNYMVKHGIKKVDNFVLTHYHSDHYTNINGFLNNQNAVDFSETKWYIPSYYEGLSEKATVKGWLAAADADYQELTEDITLHLDTDVHLDIICNSNEFHAAITSTDLNEHCNVAILRHGKVNVLYMADAYGQEIPYILQHYDLPRTDLIKLSHHGVSVKNTDSDSIFYQKIAAKLAIINHGHGQKGQSSASAWASDDGYTNFVTLYGGETYHICYDDAEFISNGICVRKITSNYPMKSYTTTPKLVFYVDANANVNDTPNGSVDRPFTSIMEAMKALPIFADRSVVELNIAPGTYTALRAECLSGRLIIKKYGEGDILIKHILINNCQDVQIATTITTNQLLAAKSYIYNSGAITLTINSDSAFADSDIKTNLSVPCSSTTPNTKALAIEACMWRATSVEINVEEWQQDIALTITKSLVDFRTLTVDGIQSAIGGGRSSFISIGDFVVKNVSAAVLNTYWGCVVDIQNKPTLTNVTATSLTGHTGGLITYAGKTSTLGTTANRPTKYVTTGFLYFDTTIKKLLMLNAGTWVDTTTGNTVS